MNNDYFPITHQTGLYNLSNLLKEGTIVDKNMLSECFDGIYDFEKSFGVVPNFDEDSLKITTENTPIIISIASSLDDILSNTKNIELLSPALKGGGWTLWVC